MTPSSENVISAVCTVLKVSRQDICGADRRAPIMFARQMAMLALREIAMMKLEPIGRVVNKHHATVLYGVRAAEEAIRLSPRAKTALVEIGDVARSEAQGKPRQPATHTATSFQADQIRALRRSGWSLMGLSRKYGLPEREIAELLGENNLVSA